MTDDKFLPWPPSKPPAKRGRPTLYSEQWAKKFCALVAQGKSVAEVCRRRDQPSEQSVYLWRSMHAGFAEALACAREAQAHKLAKETLELSDKIEDDNSVKVQRARLQVDTRKWLASKIAPRHYGDHVEHNVKGGINFQPMVLISCSNDRPDEGPRIKIVAHEPGEM
jgi:Bacteriophage Sf6, terminase small subunit-like